MDHIVVIRELRVFRIRKLTLSLVEHRWHGSRMQLLMLVAILEHLADFNIAGDLGRLIGLRVVAKVLVRLDRLCDSIRIKLVCSLAAVNHPHLLVLVGDIGVPRLNRQMNRRSRVLLPMLPLGLHRGLHLDLYAAGSAIGSLRRCAANRVSILVLAVAEDSLLDLILDLVVILLAEQEMLTDGQCFGGPRVTSHFERQHVTVKLRLDNVQVLSVLLIQHLDPILGLFGRQSDDLDVVVVQLYGLSRRFLLLGH